MLNNKIRRVSVNIKMSSIKFQVNRKQRSGNTVNKELARLERKILRHQILMRLKQRRRNFILKQMRKNVLVFTREHPSKMDSTVSVSKAA